MQMPVQSSFKRTLVAISAALAMSTVAVGAAVGPAQAAGNPVQVAANA
jgi:F0F1-type ATP synthase membrane subunit c/vacuolar-type H+-ATPase subunit K